MGLIRDPGYVVGKIVSVMGHDIALAQMFAEMAVNPELVSDTLRPGFVRMGDNKALGAIAGKYVEENLARDLYTLAKAGDDAVKIYDALMAVWKEGKTVSNPATHGRNILGNIMFADFACVSPVSPANWGYFSDAWTLVVKRQAAGSVNYAELYDQGVLGGDIGQQEFATAISAMMGPSPNLTGFAAVLGKLRENVNNAYQVEDALFKAAAYVKARKSGLSPKAAAEYVRQWFPYYDEIAQSGTVRTLKRTIMPFYSFYAESMRIANNAIRYRPATFLKYMAMPTLLTHIGLTLLGYDDDDKEAVQAELRGHQKLGPLDFYMSMPFVVNGELHQIDLTNVNPYASSVGMRVEEGREPDPMLVRLGRGWLSSPMTSMAIATLMNRDVFTDKPVIHSEMRWWEQAGAVLKALYNTLAPAPVTTSGAVPRTADLGVNLLPPQSPLKDLAQRMDLGQVQRSTMAKRTAGGDVLRSWTGIDIRNATPQVWRIANRWAQRNGIGLGPEPGGDTDRIGRARQRIYQAILNNNPRAVQRELDALGRIGAKDRKAPNAVLTAKQFAEIIDSRDPLSNLRGEKGEKGEDRRARFLKEISPVERASVEKLTKEWLAMKQTAIRDIWPEVLRLRKQQAAEEQQGGYNLPLSGQNPPVKPGAYMVPLED
jgi:hypothetical protein